MKQVSGAVWLNDLDVCSIEHLAEISGLAEADILDLVESGVIKPVEAHAAHLSFHLEYVVTAKTARRLRDDFELDRHGVAVALVLLKRIESLQEKLRELSAVGPTKL
jgi:chaperone modulatory protein CbpM